MQKQMMRRDRRRFSASEDSALTKQIQASHAPDGSDVDVRPILVIIEDILGHATQGIHDAVVSGTHENTDSVLEDKASVAASEGMPEALACIIQKASCEISCKCTSGGDAHTTTMTILTSLSSYSWDAKIVISLAAFATTYGEFWLLIILNARNRLARSIALLKQLPDVIVNPNVLTSRLDGVNKLIKAVMDVTKCVVGFRQLPDRYISAENPAMSTAMAHVPTAVYWTIRSIVACADQVAGLVGMSQEYDVASAAEAWELSSLAHKESNIHEHLLQQLALCHQHIDEKKQAEAYDNLLRLFETTHIDSTRILKALTSKDDLQPIIECRTRKRVPVLEVFRKKTTLLLLSDLEISGDELEVLDHIYQESRLNPEYQYDVLWLPIVDRSIPWNDQHEERFKGLQSSMSWYTIYHPSMLEPAVVRYIRKVWRFNKKPILVTLDPFGKVACPDALHMVWIWRNAAYPFSTAREEGLWREETWRIELVVDEIEPSIPEWVGRGKYICLYGGEDLDWIRTFTSTAKKVFQTAGIQLEMIYVGKSKAKHTGLQKLIATIETEKLSRCWKDSTTLWYFWTRLECMLYSKMRHGKNADNDNIMQEVMTLLSFDGSDQGWAMIWKGSNVMARAKGDNVVRSLESYEEWKEDAGTRGFIVALKDYLMGLHTPQHCNRLILPGIEGGIPERVVCAECGRTMEKFVMYRCCDD